jgi:hypothetical protein
LCNSLREKLGGFDFLGLRKPLCCGAGNKALLTQLLLLKRIARLACMANFIAKLLTSLDYIQRQIFDIFSYRENYFINSTYVVERGCYLTAVSRFDSFFCFFFAVGLLGKKFRIAQKSICCPWLR